MGNIYNLIYIKKISYIFAIIVAISCTNSYSKIAVANIMSSIKSSGKKFAGIGAQAVGAGSKFAGATLDNMVAQKSMEVQNSQLDIKRQEEQLNREQQQFADEERRREREFNREQSRLDIQERKNDIKDKIDMVKELGSIGGLFGGATSNNVSPQTPAGSFVVQDDTEDDENIENAGDQGDDNDQGSFGRNGVCSCDNNNLSNNPNQFTIYICAPKGAKTKRHFSMALSRKTQNYVPSNTWNDQKQVRYNENYNYSTLSKSCVKKTQFKKNWCPFKKSNQSIRQNLNY